MDRISASRVKSTPKKSRKAPCRRCGVVIALGGHNYQVRYCSACLPYAKADGWLEDKEKNYG